MRWSVDKDKARSAQGVYGLYGVSLQLHPNCARNRKGDANLAA